ncbi:HAMP domain-containing protein, partial [Teichococcus deserti]|uniref:HAMP domain-containing protein n=1 Tax=Teichococcus deserti TaxID=1817963 RepID=UPI0013F5FD7F
MRPIFRKPTTIAVRLPLLVGLAVFLSAVGTTHLALRITERERDQEAQRLAGVYVDSLAGLTLPLIRSGDLAGLEATLERGMGFQRGVSDLAIVVADPAGKPLARVGQPTEEPPMAFGLTRAHWSPNPEADTAWMQLELGEDGKVEALIAAQLAFPEQAARHRRLIWRLTLLDAALAAAAAGLSMLFARRMMRPILAVTEALQRAGQGGFAPLPAGWRDAEAAGLAESFNTMAARLQEREVLAASLAERERAAVLGRLAASLAHEVRNPLAGMLTALDTIRR